MIEGIVNGFLEAVVSLPVRGPDGREQLVDAVIDTGYSGTLTLPPTLVAELELPYVIRSRSALADGTVVAFNVHGATVVWDGRPRYIDIDAVGVAPLLGMSMLEGHDLHVRVNDGGRVAIQPAEGS
ncbi:MAG: clan AA aspartic protease [Acidimicrobiaceae bacterium]|nr:clan AA aspartic protease [Acidimicrobiaceae bacterium]